MAEQKLRTVTDWAAIARHPKFLELHRRKTTFLFGWWLASATLYFLFTLGAGFAPGLYRTKVAGPLNFGFVFGLAQFFISWGIALHYSRVANARFDRLTAELGESLRQGGAL